MPGQFGLNAGVIPDPGFTYANLAVNYSADQLNNASGNPFPHVTGTYSFWVDENIIYYVPSQKILGGYFMPYITLSYATGELVADITGTRLSSGGGGSGFADMYVEPINFGWHLLDNRLDFNAGYAFTAPTGRYSPGASDNVGSGYWGHNITTGTILYITKDHGTTVNLATDWEIHGSREAAGFPVGRTSEITPGQAFTMEWGIGQALPLTKDQSVLAQIGLIGYDQWQVTDNSGNFLLGRFSVPASRLPHHSVHGIGGQANLIFTKWNLMFFFKYCDEYSAWLDRRDAPSSSAVPGHSVVHRNRLQRRSTSRPRHRWQSRTMFAIVTAVTARNDGHVNVCAPLTIHS